jgi:hypothetical protein
MAYSLKEGWIFQAYRKKQPILTHITGISFDLVRDMAPIYTMGGKRPVDFSISPETAGTIFLIPSLTSEKFDEIRVAPYSEPNRVIYTFYDIDILNPKSTKHIDSNILLFVSKLNDHPAQPKRNQQEELMNKETLYNSDLLIDNNKIVKTRYLNSFSDADFELYNNGQKTSDNVTAASYFITKPAVSSEPIIFGKKSISGTLLFSSTPTSQNFDELRLIYFSGDYQEKATFSIFNVNLLSDKYGEYIPFSAEGTKNWGVEKTAFICECGAEKCGFTSHSSWCPASGKVKP